ncbi:MAG: hypothetical protein WCS94_12780 [Verrucomicrobiota bacterium]
MHGSKSIRSDVLFGLRALRAAVVEANQNRASATEDMANALLASDRINPANRIALASKLPRHEAVKSPAAASKARQVFRETVGGGASLAGMDKVDRDSG